MTPKVAAYLCGVLGGIGIGLVIPMLWMRQAWATPAIVGIVLVLAESALSRRVFRESR